MVKTDHFQKDVPSVRKRTGMERKTFLPKKGVFADE
jgi:hypothetical protein